MTDAVRTWGSAARRGGWRDRPRRMAWLALGWAVAQGGFALITALHGRGPTALAWFVVAVAALAAVAAVAAARGLDRPGLRVVLRGACGLSAASAFGLLMDVAGLLFGQGADDPAATVLRALGLLGAVLLALTARNSGALPAARPAGTTAPPPPVPRGVRLAAYAGTVAFVPYAAMKLCWALGGTFAGISGAQMYEISRRNGASGIWLTLQSWGLDGTVLLAALGVFLLFGLIRPWGLVFPRWAPGLSGRRVPRWLPLTPALIGAATLVPYGVLGTGYLTLVSFGVFSIPRGDFPTEQDTLLVGWIGMGAFAVYGVALLAAARSYWLRTRYIK